MAGARPGSRASASKRYRPLVQWRNALPRNPVPPVTRTCAPLRSMSEAVGGARLAVPGHGLSDPGFDRCQVTERHQLSSALCGREMTTVIAKPCRTALDVAGVAH